MVNLPPPVLAGSQFLAAQHVGELPAKNVVRFSLTILLHVEAAVHEVKSVALQAHVLGQLPVINCSLAVNDAWILERLAFRH